MRKENRKGKLLALIRKKLWGFTQSDLALAMGVDKNTIARYERGESSISKQVGMHILALLQRDGDSDKLAKFFSIAWESCIEGRVVE